MSNWWSQQTPVIKIGVSCGAVVLCLISRHTLDQIIRAIYGYPPANSGILPCVGSLVFLRDPTYFNKLKRKYGSISMIQIGMKYCVVI